jgi:hypothetical protein
VTQNAAVEHMKGLHDGTPAWRLKELQRIQHNSTDWLLQPWITTTQDRCH